MLGALIASISVATTQGIAAETEGMSYSANLPGDSAQIAISDLIDQATARSEAFEDELTSPEAVRERLLSRTKYADLNHEQIVALFRHSFSSQLGAIDQDPSRQLTDESVDRILGLHTVVSHDGDQKFLIETPTPTVSKIEDGVNAPVDLSLEESQSGDAYEPSNPLISTTLPKRTTDSIVLGEGETSIEVNPVANANVPNSLGLRFGNTDIFYPEVAVDTDLLAAPVSGGVELMYMLRSSLSPNSIPIDLSNDEVSKVVQSGDALDLLSATGDVIASVQPPIAVDAQGRELGVNYDISDGGRVSLSVRHTEEEVAYPILVDPVVENWQDGPDGNNTRSWWHGYNYDGLTQWGWNASTSNVVGMKECDRANGRYCWGSGYGLYLYTKPNINYASNSWGQFSYTAPGGSASRILGADVGPEYLHRNNCTGSERPAGYIGLWKPATSTWVDLISHGVGLNGLYESVGSNDVSSSAGVKSLIAGIGTGTGSLNLACWREFAVGGAVIRLGEDGSPPTISSSDPTSGWIGGSTQPGFTISASDSGLGIKSIEITAPTFQGVGEPYGQKTWKTTNDCTGGRAQPCPTTWTVNNSTPLNFVTSEMPDGYRTVEIRARDVLGNLSDPVYKTVRVDNSKPTVELSGTIGSNPGSVTTDNLTLRVESGDGLDSAPGEDPSSPMNPEDYQSGVVWVIVQIDGALRFSDTSGCPLTGNCSRSSTIPLQAADRTVGAHTLRVLTIDAAGNSNDQTTTYTVTQAPSTPTTSPTGTVLHATRYEQQNGSVGSRIDETWAEVNAIEGARMSYQSGFADSVTLSTCSYPNTVTKCETYRQAILIPSESSVEKFDWRTIRTDEQGNVDIPNVTQATRAVSNLPVEYLVEEVPLSSYLRSWQRFPYGTVGRYAQHFRRIADNLQEDIWVEKGSGLLLEDVLRNIQSQTVLSAAYSDYDSGLYDKASLPQRLQQTPKPAAVLDETHIDAVSRSAAASPLVDQETGRVIRARYLGAQKDLEGIGKVCLARIDNVEMSYGQDAATPGLDNEDPDDAQLNGSVAPLTFVSANYVVASGAEVCPDAVDAAEAGNRKRFSVTSLDAASTSAKSKLAADLLAAQSEGGSVETGSGQQPTYYLGSPSSESGTGVATSDGVQVGLTGDLDGSDVRDVLDELVSLGN